jgi:hypothetical protein
MKPSFRVQRASWTLVGWSMLPATVFALAMLAAPCSDQAAMADERQVAPLANPPAGEITLRGECFFNRNKGTFTAKLKPAGDNTYDVVYDVVWGGRNSTWKGTIKSDLKGEISGSGTGGSGTFEFSGKFVNGVARCPYRENGPRGRSGSLTLTR